MSRKRIHLELCTTPEQAERAKAFLAEFDHELVPHCVPLRLVKSGEKIIGVAQECRPTVFFTSWNPNDETVSDREVVAGVDAIRILSEGLTAHGVMYVAVPEDSPVGPDQLKKLRFFDTGCRLWASYPFDDVDETEVLPDGRREKAKST